MGRLMGFASGVKAWMVALAAGMAVVVAAFLAGRRGATDRARAQAAADEQAAQRRGEHAAADAERAGARDRLSSGNF